MKRYELYVDEVTGDFLEQEDPQGTYVRFADFDRERRLPTLNTAGLTQVPTVARLTARQEQIICELSPEHSLLCSADANELGELADMGIVDLRCGVRMAGLTPVGETLGWYVNRVRKIEARS